MIITARPGTQQRFRETMDFFFQAVTQQAKDRDAGIVPDLESYIALRRDTRYVLKYGLLCGLTDALCSAVASLAGR